MSYYAVEMLPAEIGDCLWIEYGDEANPHRMLIDGGTGGTEAMLRARMESLARSKKTLRFDLVVCTHIDNDHIPGILGVLGNPPRGLRCDDIWFNGNKHLPAVPGVLGVPEGEGLSTLLASKALPWNCAVKGAALVVPDTGPLPRFDLPGGMVLTLLSPSPAKMTALAKVWKKELAKLSKSSAAGPGRGVLGSTAFPTDLAALQAAADRRNGDRSAPNGSSIAFLAEYGGKKCLFGGDAHAPVLEASLRRYIQERGIKRVKLDAFKLSHHGSKNNTNKTLLDLVECNAYLISTNGKAHKHPDVEAIARVILQGTAPTLHFNYDSEYTSPWNSRPIINAPPFFAQLPPRGKPGKTILL
ncbi:MAG: hypothetical protein WCZ23_00335 [Rhodospirillaceae bacterium]